jgi:hypothetical protein
VGGAAPEGLDSKRIAFKKQGQIEKGSWNFKRLSLLQRQAQASDQLLDERVELLVGAQLLRAGVLTRMRKGTPDFDLPVGRAQVRCRGDHASASGGRRGIA